MRTAGFTLVPFNWPHAPNPVLTGNLTLGDGILQIKYEFSGLNDPAVFPAPSANPARRLQLWRRTCFELLWGPIHHPNYWELNASPAGHWNILAFADYRRGMAEEPRIAASIGTLYHAHGFSLCCTLPVAALECPGPFRLAPAAILRLADGQRTFWAVHHPGETPDFHHPLSFTLTA